VFHHRRRQISRSSFRLLTSTVETSALDRYIICMDRPGIIPTCFIYNVPSFSSSSSSSLNGNADHICIRRSFLSFFSSFRPAQTFAFVNRHPKMGEACQSFPLQHRLFNPARVTRTRQIKSINPPNNISDKLKCHGTPYFILFYFSFDSIRFGLLGSALGLAGLGIK
jgi:hypothetical protein